MATIHEASITSAPSSEADPRRNPPESKNHLLLLSLTGPMHDRLEDLVSRSGYEKAELINLAVALFKASLDAIEEGKRVGIVDDDRDMQLEFRGFHKDDSTV